jgi:hypothetical protein
MQQPQFTAFALILAVGLFVGMLIFLEVGRQIGRRQLTKYGGEGRKGVGVVDGSVYGLLALLVGFTFSDGASRFHDRRQLVIDEVEAIHNAWERIELVPPESQEPIRTGFRNYLDAVIHTYQQPAGSEAEAEARRGIARGRKEVWSNSVAAVTVPSGDGEKARMLLLPANTEMFAAVESERMARQAHAPPMVFAMLAFTALAAALFAGFALAPDKRRAWIFIVGVAATISLSAYVIIDLEYPRAGLIRADMMDRELVELRRMMN